MAISNDSAGLVASGLQNFTIVTGDGNDVVSVVPSAERTIDIDCRGGWDELIVNPEGGGVAFGEKSILVSGMQSITYTAETEVITVDGLGSLRTEGGDNDTFGTATALSLVEDPAGSGYFIGRGIGSIEP